MRVQQTNLVEEIAGRGLTKKSVQRRLALAGLGVLRALRESSMTIDDAESDLFNLETYKAARRRRYDQQLIEFLEWGMELDDVARLAPHALEESYQNMERLVLRWIARSHARRSPRRNDVKRD